MTGNQVISMASNQVKSVSLVDGKFSPSEASDILNALIDKKINFHKLQVLSRVEGNEKDECSFDNDRLQELKNHKVSLNEIIKDARLNGKKLKINSVINIEFFD